MTLLALLLFLVTPAIADEAHDRKVLLRQFDREISRFQKRVRNILHEYYDSPYAAAWNQDLEQARIQREERLAKGKRVRGKDKDGVPETVIEDYFRDADEDPASYTVNRGGLLEDSKVAPNLIKREELEQFLKDDVIAALRKNFEARMDAEGATQMRARIRAQYTGVNSCLWKRLAAWTGFGLLVVAEAGLAIAMLDPTWLTEAGLSWASGLFIGGSPGDFALIFGGAIALISLEFALTKKKIAPPIRCRFQRRLT